MRYLVAAAAAVIYLESAAVLLKNVKKQKRNEHCRERERVGVRER